MNHLDGNLAYVSYSKQRKENKHEIPTNSYNYFYGIHWWHLVLLYIFLSTEMVIWCFQPLCWKLLPNLTENEAQEVKWMLKNKAEQASSCTTGPCSHCQAVLCHMLTAPCLSWRNWRASQIRGLLFQIRTWGNFGSPFHVYATNTEDPRASLYNRQQKKLFSWQCVFQHTQPP